MRRPIERKRLTETHDRCHDLLRSALDEAVTLGDRELTFLIKMALLHLVETPHPGPGPVSAAE